MLATTPDKNIACNTGQQFTEMQTNNWWVFNITPYWRIDLDFAGIHVTLITIHFHFWWNESRFNFSQLAFAVVMPSRLGCVGLCLFPLNWMQWGRFQRHKVLHWKQLTAQSQPHHTSHVWPVSHVKRPQPSEADKASGSLGSYLPGTPWHFHHLQQHAWHVPLLQRHRHTHDEFPLLALVSAQVCIT